MAPTTVLQQIGLAKLHQHALGALRNQTAIGSDQNLTPSGQRHRNIFKNGFTSFKILNQLFHNQYFVFVFFVAKVFAWPAAPERLQERSHHF